MKKTIIGFRTLMNKLTEVQNYNNKVTPELNKKPDYLIINIIKSLNAMIKGNLVCYN